MGRTPAPSRHPFVSGPLAGRTVAVTRDGDPDDRLVALLEEAGARTVVWPTLAFAPPDDPTALLDALAEPDRWDWLVFTSARAVEPVATHLGDLADLRARIAAVGDATAAAVRHQGGVVSVIGGGGGRALARALASEADLSGAHVLFPAASRASDDLVDALENAGAVVARVDAYRTVLRPPEGVAVRRDLEAGVDAVTFVSPSAATALDHALDGSLGRTLGTRATVAIGATTAAAVRELGVRRVAVADRPSLESLVEAVIHLLEEPEG